MIAPRRVSGGYLQALTPEQRGQIQAVAMDMWAPYIQAVDRVCRREHRELQGVGDDTLVRTKYLWLYGCENVPERHQDRFDRLVQLNLRTAKIIQRDLANVLTYVEHRITNAVSEGLNSKIQRIKKMAYGFRNREHFKTAIYFHCGGLDLYPVTHGIPV
jgi:transposase